MKTLLLALCAVMTIASCSTKTGNTSVKDEVKDTYTARVQLAFYNEMSKQWELNPYVPVRIKEVDRHFHVGDIIGGGRDSYMILSFADEDMAEFSIKLLREDSLAIHDNLNDVTIGIIRGRDNRTLDSLLTYEADL